MPQMTLFLDFEIVKTSNFSHHNTNPERALPLPPRLPPESESEEATLVHILSWPKRCYLYTRRPSLW